MLIYITETVIQVGTCDSAYKLNVYKCTCK